MLISLSSVNELHTLGYCSLLLQLNKHLFEWAACTPEDRGEWSCVGFLGWVGPEEVATPVWCHRDRAVGQTSNIYTSPFSFRRDSKLVRGRPGTCLILLGHCFLVPEPRSFVARLRVKACQQLE